MVHRHARPRSPIPFLVPFFLILTHIPSLHAFVTQIDDQSSSVVYIGEWTHSDLPSFFNSTVSSTSSGNFTLSFSGFELTLVCLATPSPISFALSLDGNSLGTHTFALPSSSSSSTDTDISTLQNCTTITNMTDTPHLMSMQIFPSQSGATFTLDSFTVLTNTLITSVPVNTTSSQSTSPTTVASTFASTSPTSSSSLPLLMPLPTTTSSHSHKHTPQPPLPTPSTETDTSTPSTSSRAAFIFSLISGILASLGMLFGIFIYIRRRRRRFLRSLDPDPGLDNNYSLTPDLGFYPDFRGGAFKRFVRRVCRRVRGFGAGGAGSGGGGNESGAEAEPVAGTEWWRRGTNQTKPLSRRLEEWNFQGAYIPEGRYKGSVSVPPKSGGGVGGGDVRSGGGSGSGSGNSADPTNEKEAQGIERTARLSKPYTPTPSPGIMMEVPFVLSLSEEMASELESNERLRGSRISLSNAIRDEDGDGDGDERPPTPPPKPSRPSRLTSFLSFSPRTYSFLQRASALSSISSTSASASASTSMPMPTPPPPLPQQHAPKLTLRPISSGLRLDSNTRSSTPMSPSTTTSLFTSSMNAFPTPPLTIPPVPSLPSRPQSQFQFQSESRREIQPHELPRRPSPPRPQSYPLPLLPPLLPPLPTPSFSTPLLPPTAPLRIIPSSKSLKSLKSQASLQNVNTNASSRSETPAPERSNYSHSHSYSHSSRPSVSTHPDNWV